MAKRKTASTSASPELRREVAEAGFGRGRWRDAGEGWEAACFILEADDGRSLVLKVAREGVAGTSVPIAVEAEALRAFGAALDPAGPVHAPAVVHIFSEFDAYLMEQAPGQALLDYLLRARLPKGWDTTLARRLVDGLVVYHRTMGEPFGDFHPGNVLVAGAAEPWFVDPVTRNPRMLMLEQAGVFAPGAVDLGQFVFKAVSRIPRPAAATPWAVWRLLRLTRKLVREAAARFAPGHQRGFEAAVREVALAHLAVLAAQPWPRDHAAAFAGRKLLPVVLPRA